METIMVVAGIWTMCAICAVLFIRGAASHAPRPVREQRPARDGETAERTARLR